MNRLSYRTSNSVACLMFCRKLIRNEGSIILEGSATVIPLIQRLSPGEEGENSPGHGRSCSFPEPLGLPLPRLGGCRAAAPENNDALIAGISVFFGLPLFLFSTAVDIAAEPEASPIVPPLGCSLPSTARRSGVRLPSRAIITSLPGAASTTTVGSFTGIADISEPLMSSMK